MSEHLSDAWRQADFTHICLPRDNVWLGSHTPAMSDIRSTDMRSFLNQDYDESFHRNSGAMLSPHLSYVNENDWPSDLDMRTPSTTGFPIAQVEDCLTNTASGSFTVPSLDDRMAASTYSPSSSFESASPKHHFMMSRDVGRPTFSRSRTAPEPRPRKDASVISWPTPMKRLGIEDGGGEEDEEASGRGRGGGVEHDIFGEGLKSRGRKRQRIPHTAVERRYREALNTGIKSLQLAVIASKKASGNFESPADEKPSKSTILQSAIEQIQTLSRENVGLKEQMKVLRSRLDDIENWCASSSAGYGRY